LQQLGRNENKRGAEVTALILKQKKTVQDLFAIYGVSRGQPSVKIQAHL
jgi:acyl-CoA dehydrogenase